MVYDNFIDVCKEKGTSVTTVLKALGKSTGSTGNWSKGQFPRLDIVMEMADYLGVTIDKLVYNREIAPSTLSDSEQEWLNIISQIPIEKQPMCKDFLRTHMVKPEKYKDKKKA